MLSSECIFLLPSQKFWLFFSTPSFLFLHPSKPASSSNLLRGLQVKCYQAAATTCHLEVVHLDPSNV